MVALACVIVVFIRKFAIVDNFGLIVWAFRLSMRTFGARIAAAEERDCALTFCRMEER